MSDVPPVVCCVWEDAAAMEGGPWVENKPRTYRPHIVTTVGFLIFDGPEGVQITGSWHPDLIGTPDQIPRGMIRSITYLQPVPDKRRRK